jgi:biotin synthase
MNISRVDWPEYSIEDVENRLSSNHSLKRVCIQCSDEQDVRDGLVETVSKLHSAGERPITVSSPPIGADLMAQLKGAGADMLTVPIDCANDSLFTAIKGMEPELCWQSLEEALKVFGPRKVVTHIIVGLGETEMDAVRLIDKLSKVGIIPSLFAFTPVRGTAMEHRNPPAIASYRRVQLARHLIVERGCGFESFGFDSSGKLNGFLGPAEMLSGAIAGGDALVVCGCPGCNRPYFNERVTGPFYNFARKPSKEEISKIGEELLGCLEGS